MKNLKAFDQLNESFGPVTIGDVRYVCEKQIEVHEKQVQECTDSRCKEIYKARQDAFQMILDYVNNKKED